jgi:MFS family permease
MILLIMVMCLNAGTFAYGPLNRIFHSPKRLVLGGVLVMTSALAVLAALPNPGLYSVVTLLAVFSFATPIFVTLAAHCRSFVPEYRAGRAIAVINLIGVGFIFLLQGVTGWIIESLAVDGIPTEFGYRLVFGTVALTLVITGGFYAFSKDAPRRG